ncbi:MAG: transporter substrate-binding domain-containing protein [Treponema sp.]|jgi:putative glutamine transport system substrate-binding protein|nr:transporter substrate-binding domain-containing protein [Treponema sp.]
MKIRLLLLMQLFTLGCLLSGCNNTLARSAQVQAIRKRGILQVGTQSDVPRLSYANPETGELEGLEIDLARNIAEALFGDQDAVAFTIVTTPLRGPLLDNGEIDVIIAAYTITEERKQHYNITRPYYIDEVGLLVRKDSGLTGLADMENKRIGVIRGATTAQAVTREAEKLGIRVQFLEFSSNPPTIAALLNREIDAFSLDKSILLGYLQEGTVILPDGFDPQEYGIAIKLENDQLAAYMDSLIMTMQQDGTLPALLQKWEL